MTRIVLLAALLLVVIAGSAMAETVAGLPVHIQKFESGAIRVWIGDHVSSTAVVAIPTEKGLVIIDTTGNPKVDRELRGIIARELGRDDFITLINTHEHRDHTGGNAVYADCTIVGHEKVAAGMAMSPESKQRTIAWLTTRIPELETEISNATEETPETARQKEQLTLYRLDLEVAQSGAELVPPTETFSDRMVLEYGDTTFELYFIGGMHSSSDIAILVPEHGLLMTGDTMADVWLTDTPGCLASFAARTGVEHDFPLQIANWNTLLTRKDDIDTYVPGHWNGELSYEGFEARVKYIEALWAGANEAAEAGTSLETMMTEYDLETRFPSLVDSPGCNLGNHQTTILEMWSETTNMESAAVVLYDLLDEGADDKAIDTVIAQRGAEKPNYYFIEAQINVYGYRFLQTERVAEAIRMLRINVELFPEAWNVYDSLGEALYAAGQNEEALVMYQKSLELYPESPTGMAMLETIRGETNVN
jgi:glyoxylase-like metal-dependent hydrolase (beta-lactamase superfamily II)